MLDSIQDPFQVILWPLVGALLILALGRLVGRFGQRLLSLAACIASLAAVVRLRAGDIGRVEIGWEPLNLLRMSPALEPDGLSVLAATILIVVAGALVVAMRGRRFLSWRSWMLVALSGGLVTIFGANLLTCTLGSALLDMALLATVTSTSHYASADQRMPLSIALPGVASTLILFFAALQTNSPVGDGSLALATLSEESLILVGVAGLLRSFAFPVHARRFGSPMPAATLLLPVAVGGYLLMRVQSLIPIMSSRPWAMVVALTGLLVGGLLVWNRGLSSREPDSDDDSSIGGVWSGILVQAVGFLFVFVLVLPGVIAWPLINLLLALAVLVIWQDASLEMDEVKRARWLEWLRDRMAPWWTRVKLAAQARVASVAWLWDERTRRFGRLVLPSIALASLAGVPLALGARARWPVYAAWLQDGSPVLLFILAADTLMAAGLWLALRVIWAQPERPVPGVVSLLTMCVLVTLIVVWGMAPGVLVGDLGLKNAGTNGVSVWGLGLLYVLPWLLGAWLVRVKRLPRRHLDRVERIVNLDWFYMTAGRAADGFVGAIHWLGRVGEGDGWWGWVLVVLAVGFMLLAGR